MRSRGAVILRPPAPDDALPLAEAWFEAEHKSLVDGYPEGFPPEWFWMESVETAAEQWRRGFLAPQPSVQTWVADLGGVPVGFSQAGPAEDDHTRGCLRSLYVHPRAWGSGAGSHLHDAALAYLREGYTTCDLWVIEGNAHTRRFYERRGWTATGDFMRVGNGLPLVRYTLELARPSAARLRATTEEGPWRK